MTADGPSLASWVHRAILGKQRGRPFLGGQSPAPAMHTCPRGPGRGASKTQARATEVGKEPQATDQVPPGHGVRGLELGVSLAVSVVRVRRFSPKRSPNGFLMGCDLFRKH